MAATPRPRADTVSVGLGLLVEGGRVLLLRRERDPFGGLWSLPGGKAEPGETLEQTCARELREELGWEVRVGRLRLFVEEVLVDADGTDQRNLLAIFRCRPPDAAIPPEGCAWFPLGALPDDRAMIPTDRRFIADALALPEGAGPQVRRARVGPGSRILAYE